MKLLWLKIIVFKNNNLCCEIISHFVPQYPAGILCLKGISESLLNQNCLGIIEFFGLLLNMSRCNNYEVCSY
jgi:hypothetical protein